MNQNETKNLDFLKEELKANHLCLSNSKKFFTKYSIKKTNKIK